MPTHRRVPQVTHHRLSQFPHRQRAALEHDLLDRRQRVRRINEPALVDTDQVIVHALQHVLSARYAAAHQGRSERRRHTLDHTLAMLQTPLAHLKGPT